MIVENIPLLLLPHFPKLPGCVGEVCECGLVNQVDTLAENRQACSPVPAGQPPQPGNNSGAQPLTSTHKLPLTFSKGSLPVLPATLSPHTLEQESIHNPPYRRPILLTPPHPPTPRSGYLYIPARLT